MAPAVKKRRRRARYEDSRARYDEEVTQRRAAAGLKFLYALAVETRAEEAPEREHPTNMLYRRNSALWRGYPAGACEASWGDLSHDLAAGVTYGYLKFNVSVDGALPPSDGSPREPIDFNAYDIGPFVDDPETEWFRNGAWYRSGKWREGMQDLIG